jgi:hypothetical protein
LVQNRISAPEELKKFNLGGYQYRDGLSQDDAWVFTRRQPAGPN